ncbi:MAG TPA: Ig-like domain-containing protein, partial [Thermoanaerobaculia bacterium]
TAASDAYNYIGNTELRIASHAGNSAALASTTAASNPIANDSDPDSIASGFGTISIVAVASGTSAQGGTYSLDSDGKMVYTPPAGHTGADSVTYQLTDGTNTVNGTINFTMSGTDVVWYVKNNDATADGSATKDGTSSYPFNTLAAASAASDVNEIIYVHSGDGTTAGQNSGIVLKNGQKLYGQAVALVVNGSTTLIAAGSQPQIGNAGGAGVTATNLSNVQIKGLNIGGSTDAIFASTSGANSGSIEIATNIIRAAGTEGIDLDGGGSGSFVVSVHDNTVTSTGNAIDIARTAGTVVVTAIDGNTISGNTAGSGIVVNTATFDANTGVGGFQSVSGGTTVVGSSVNPVGASGIVLSNVQGVLAFTQLNIFNSNGTGLGATGTGGGFTLSATPLSSAIGSTGGPAIDLNSVAASTLQLLQVTSTNSTTTGINLNTVTGTVSAGTGSAITNAANTDFNVSGGSVSTAWPGTITDDVGQLVRIASNSGTHTFTGAITDGDDADGGVATEGSVHLASNSGTITFSGGLLLNTGANHAFRASGGGTINVCALNPCGGATAVINKLTTTTGTPLMVDTVNFGTSGLTFRTVSANGAANGIFLKSTGSSTAGLTVTGTGSAGTGGTIQ